MNILEENQNATFYEETPQFNIWKELLILIILVFGCAIISNLLMLLIAMANGLDMKVLMNGLNENSPVGERNLIRLLLFINNAGMFLLPSFLFVKMRYRQDWSSYLKIQKMPDILNIAYGTAILLVSLPLVQYVFFLNKMIPLPEWMHNVENDTETLLKGLLKTEHWYEVVLNVLVVALTPALGEEFIFRGIIQQHFTKYFGKNYHIAIWLTGAIFSTIHFQFEGFFPRMILGAILGYVFYYTRNIWVSVAAHFINNASQVVAYQAFKDKKIETDIENMNVPWQAGFVSLLITVYLIYMLREKNREAMDI